MVLVDVLKMPWFWSILQSLLRQGTQETGGIFNYFFKIAFSV